MKIFVIEYKDPDPACPVFRCIIRAYSKDHAIEKFYNDDDDWEIISVSEK